jgi:hypothetical protein
MHTRFESRGRKAVRRTVKVGGRFGFTLKVSGYDPGGYLCSNVVPLLPGPGYTPRKKPPAKKPKARP